VQILATLPASSDARPLEGRATPVVLYVDEREDTEAERLLRAIAPNLIRCASGREAVAIVRIRPVACVVATLLLADMSATALIPALRGAAPGLAVIVVLDRPEVREAVSVMQAGAWAVVDSKVLSTGLLHHIAPLLDANPEPFVHA
jgi:DNA-binding NtrC family response regulator